MTAREALVFDVPVLDRRYRDLVDQVGHDWITDEDFKEFAHVLMLCRRGPLGLISQNDVRVRFLEDTPKGPRCSIDHNTYSGLWSRAVKEKLIEKAKRYDGKTLKDECRTSPTGNNGKDQTVYRWLGGT